MILTHQEALLLKVVVANVHKGWHRSGLLSASPHVDRLAVLAEASNEGRLYGASLVAPVAHIEHCHMR